MDLYLTNSLVQVKPARAGTPGAPGAQPKKNAGQAADFESSLPARLLNPSTSARSQLVRDETETTEDGFRRQQEFETGSGRTFSRSEEVTSDDRSARRLVVQQNVSGSIISLEEVTDRLEDGSFRKTSRFTDETGQTQTRIEVNLTADALQTYAGVQPASKQYAQGFSATAPRGNNLDVSA